MINEFRVLRYKELWFSNKSEIFYGNYVKHHMYIYVMGSWSKRGAV